MSWKKTSTLKNVVDGVEPLADEEVAEFEGKWDSKGINHDMQISQRRKEPEHPLKMRRLKMRNRCLALRRLRRTKP